MQFARDNSRALAYSSLLAGSSPQLLAFPALLQLFSRGAYLIQWAAPLLLIWPSRSIVPRLLGVGLLASMHLGFLPVLKLGLFPWVSLVCLLPLLPRRGHDPHPAAAPGGLPPAPRPE